MVSGTVSSGLAAGGVWASPDRLAHRPIASASMDFWRRIWILLMFKAPAAPAEGRAYLIGRRIVLLDRTPHSTGGRTYRGRGYAGAAGTASWRSQPLRTMRIMG